MEWRFNNSRHFRLAQLINSGKHMNISQMSKETNLVQSYLAGVFDWWTECNLIVRKREVSGVYIEFTEFGKEVFKAWEKYAKFSDQAMKNREIFREKEVQ